jgi:hypothetical protein
VTTVEDYQAQTEQLSADTVAQVLVVYAAFQAGQITQAEAEAIIATIVNQANAVALSLADVALAVQIEVATGLVTPPVGVLPVDSTDRLVKAVNTILVDQPVVEPEQPEPEPDRPDPAEMRLERLARAEPLEASQDGSLEAMQEQPRVEGWTRQMDADPCQLCEWWWREGRIWPKEHPFQKHKGCNCQPKIVVAEHIESTVFTRNLERNRAS